MPTSNLPPHLNFRPKSAINYAQLYASATLLVASSLSGVVHAQAAQPATAAASKPAESLPAIEVQGKFESTLRAAQNQPSSTASGLGLPVRELPVAVSVVDQREMQARGLRSALDAVVTAVGVTGGVLPGSIPRYATRGFTDNNVTLLRDGIKQNSIAQSSRPVDSFMLQRIEVLKGPSSMMHGEGAVGAAINYVSRQPDFVRTLDAYAGVGSFGSKRSGASITGPINELVAYQATVGIVDDAGYSDRSRNQQQSLSIGSLAKLTPALSSLLQFDYSGERLQSYFGLPVIYDAVTDVRTGVRSAGVANLAFHRLENARIDPATRQFNYNLADSYTEAKNQYLRWETRYRFNGSTSLKNTAYIATHFIDWRNSENYVWNPATRLVQRDLFHIYRDDTLTGNRTELKHEGTAGGLKYIVNGGLDLSNNDVFRGLRPSGALPAAVFNVPLLQPNSGSTPAQFARYVASSAADVKTRAVFVEAMLETSPGLKWFAGLRHDRLYVDRRDFITPATSTTVHFAPTTGRLGVNWAATPELNLYANYATSADPVNQLVSLFASQRNLPLQTGRQFEVGAHYASADGRFDASAAVYKITKNNLLVNQIINGVTVPQTVGEQAASGLELALAWRVLPGWTLDANAAYTQARFNDFKEVAANTTFVRNGNTPPNVPKLSANFFSSYRISPAWTASAGVRYVGVRFANNANLVTLPAYTVLDLAAQWDSGPWNAVLRLRNANDKQYADWAINQGLQQRLAEPRSLELTVRYRL